MKNLPSESSPLNVNPAILSQMIREIETGEELYRPSPFWVNLTRKAVSQLEQDGLQNFKRTINMKYFNWSALTIVAHQLHPMIAQWLKNPRFDIFNSKLLAAPGPNEIVNYKSFNFLSGFIYKIYLCLLYNYVSSKDPLKLLESIPEPLLGNPYLVEYRGKRISQDLCNSVHEFYSATAGIKDLDKVEHVVELGAGYGRLAYVFLKALPRCKFTIVDIPLALYVAQEYLGAVFPNDKVFKFRSFENFAEVKDEFESSRIRFVSANQIQKLPSKTADLFLNISSLHEMTKAQIDHYFSEIERITKTSFYSKQWRRSIAKENGFVIKQGGYPVPPVWKTNFDRQHPIQRLFFEASYDLTR